MRDKKSVDNLGLPICKTASGIRVVKIIVQLMCCRHQLFPNMLVRKMSSLVYKKAIQAGTNPPLLLKTPYNKWGH